MSGSQHYFLNLFNDLRGGHLEACAHNGSRRDFAIMTAARMTANRVNAQHSTGPQDTTRTRFNSVQHGLTSKQTVIPGENQQEYDDFREEFLSDLNPQSAIERTLADRAIAAAWRLKRFQGVESAFFNDRINASSTTTPARTRNPPWRISSSIPSKPKR